MEHLARRLLHRRAVVVLEVQTGEVLVMSSKPDYNLNDFSPSIPRTVAARIEEEGAWLNRAAQGLYPPGSTFKLITALAGLRVGAIRPDSHVTCTGYFQVGGRLYVVTEATEEMGKYAGTRWPMEGQFTRIDATDRLTYDARSWQEGDEEGTTIHHTNDVTLTSDDDKTHVRLHVTITQIGPKAKLAAFGMKWGYKSQLDALEKVLAG